MKRFDPPNPALIAPCARIIAMPQDDNAPLLSPQWDAVSFDIARDYPVDMLLFIAFGGGI